MEAIAHNKAFAEKVGIPQSVGKDFSKADKGKTFKRGGEMKKMKEGGKADMAQDKAMVKKALRMHDAQEHKGGKGTDLSKLKKGGMAMKKMAGGGLAAGHKSADGIATKGKTRAMMPKMSKGGKAC
jgi:hypothetical protein